MTTRPRLTPAIADVRLHVRSRIVELMTPVVELERQGKKPFVHDPETAVLVLVALSGGADSLALAAATAFEAKRYFDVTAGACGPIAPVRGLSGRFTSYLKDLRAELPRLDRVSRVTL